MRRLMLRIIFSTIAAMWASLSFDQAATADQEIAIGVAGPMSGDYAEFGAQMKRGAEKAVADLNAAGGVLGKKLILRVGDNDCYASQSSSRAVAQELARKGVVFVAGHFCSEPSAAALEVYHRQGILQITPAASHPKLTDNAASRGWNTVFRTCARDDLQAAFAGAWIAEKFKGKNIAIIDDSREWTKALAAKARASLHSAGMKEVLNESIAADGSDFRALVRKLKGANIDVIYYSGFHPEAASIVKQLRQQGLSTRFFASDALATIEFPTLAGAAADGVMFTWREEPSNLPSAQALVQQFRKDGFEPEGYTLYTYAAVQVWAQAVTKAGATDFEKVAAALRSQQWDTVIGKLSFDAKGDLRNPPFVWYVFKGGRYEATPD